MRRRARPIAAPNRYAGTSNQTFTWFISKYQGAAISSAVAIVIPKATVIPSVSLFRIRWKNSWNTKYTSRMIGAYAHPCHVRATAATAMPERRLYSTVVRFSRKKSPSPARIADALRQDSTHRFSFRVARARKKKKYPATTKKSTNASWSELLATDRWRWPGETARRNAAMSPARRSNASFTSANSGKIVRDPNRAVVRMNENVIASHGVANAGEITYPDRRAHHWNRGGRGFVSPKG